MNPVIVKLSGGDFVIDNQNNKVTEITVNPPTAKCLYDYGSPIKVVGEGDNATIEIIFPVMKKWVLSCCRLPAASLDSISDMRVVNELNAAVVSFFSPVGAITRREFLKALFSYAHVMKFDPYGMMDYPLPCLVEDFEVFSEILKEKGDAAKRAARTRG